MTITRRQFLKMSGYTLGGLVIYSSLPLALWLRNAAAAGNGTAAPIGYQPEAHQWAMVVDVTKCIGCRRCLEACKRENDVPPDLTLNRTWLEKYRATEDGSRPVELITRTEFGSEPGADTALNGFFVPKLCNQCANPPCVSVCPVNATFKTADGVILVDKERCIGCKYCLVACPYGARYLHPETKVVDKCTFCYHRVTEGLMPACVQACPTGARRFGDLNSEGSLVRRIVLEEAIQVLKPYLGTKPRVYYQGLRDGVR